jgi:hypothetical protein
MQLSTADASTLLRGENRTCHDFADLDYALDHPNSAYFKGWTTMDFDAAQDWVDSCFASPPTKGDRDRQSLLAQRRVSLANRGEIQQNDKKMKEFRDAEIQAQQDRDAELKAEESARRVEEAKEDARRRAEAAKDLARANAEEVQRRARETDRRIKEQAHNECLRSDRYRRHEAETRIIDALNRESDAQKALDRERRVEEASGTTSLSTKHSAGESLVSAQDDVTKWWTVYLQHGGDAKNPQALSRSIGDPCN